VTHMRRAMSLDPLSFFMTRRLGATLVYARNYDGALEQFQRAAEMEPDRRGVVDNWMSVAYEMKGMRDEAVDHDLAELRYGWPKLDADRLRLVYKSKGWEPYWRAHIDALRPYGDQGCLAYEAGVSYLRVGDRDRAFLSLGRAVDQRCYRVAWLKVDPLLDSIRSDARYNDLLQRVNLAPR